MVERATTAPPTDALPDDAALRAGCTDPTLGAQAARGVFDDAVNAHVATCLACALEARRWERFVAAEGSASAALREAVAAMARGARRRT